MTPPGDDRPRLPPGPAGSQSPIRPMTLSDRFTHPRLVAAAIAGAGWWLIGLGVGLVGPSSLGGAAAIVHALGLLTLVGCGILYLAFWWAAYAERKLGR